MFESVKQGRGRSTKVLGEGGLTSLLVHAAIVVVVVLVSQGAGNSKDKDKIDYSEVTFKESLPPPPEPPPPPVQPDLPPPPPPPPPPPAAAPTPTVVETPKKPKKPRPEAKPNTAVVPPPSDTPPPVEAVAGGQVGGVEGGVEGGVVGGKIGGVEGGKLGGTGDAPAPTNAVLPFGAGMERPRKLSGRDPEYTREALEAKVEGTMIVRCVIELDGKLQDCKVIKSLPYMEQAVLSALATHVYSPVMFQGRATRVNYVFNIKLMAQK